MNKKLIIIDLIAVIVYLLAANPLITGLLVHEWISIGCLLVFVVHCAVHYDWFIATVKGRVGTSNRGHLVLDIATLIVFMAVMVSGLFVSRFILPTFGLVAQGYFFWNPLHAISAKLLLALLLVHIVVHIPWFKQAFPRRGKKETSEEK